MLIKNYGLYWRADDVFWGKPGKHNDGTLDGRPARLKTGEVTNFRDQAGVYVLYDRLRPVYVGEAGVGDQGLFQRLRHHYRNELKGRWDTFSWFGIYAVNPKSRELRANVKIAPEIGDVLNHIEAILIAAMEPPLNLQRGRFGKAERFIQARHKSLALPTSEMIAEIYSAIRKAKPKRSK